jgi:uncharacterized protein YndB with AHSA1/START domain
MAILCVLHHRPLQDNRSNSQPGGNPVAEMSLSHSIVVDAPVDKVFQAFTDPEIRPKWFTSRNETRGYEPPLAVGSEWETVSTFMGREMITKYTMKNYEPPHRDVRSLQGPALGEVQHLVEEVEGGVKVTIIFNGEMKGFLASIASPLIKNQAKKDMERL